MFTGIIEEIGSIVSFTGNKIVINCNKVLDGTKIGDSISVNGVCLTVVNIDNNSFFADVSPETKKITALSKLKSGDKVNLERALTLSDRLGGHIVTGHIDTTGRIFSIKKIENFYEFKIIFDKTFSKYAAKKGSIAINGISLTIADCDENIVKIAVIPSTYTMTTLNSLNQDDVVNIEFDILSKYVEKFLLSRDNNSITADFLAENGFC